MPRKTKQQIVRERTEYMRTFEKCYTDATQTYVETLKHKYNGFVTGPEDVREVVDKYYELKTDYNILSEVYPLIDTERLKELIDDIKYEISNLINDL
jgi:hypothetical protein